MSTDYDLALRNRRTPHGAFYRDPARFAAQRAEHFAPSWQLCTAALGAREPGSVAPFVLLPGVLDEPLVATRDERGVLRCLSNVCTHRGRILVEAPGRRTTVRCGYHGRRFRLDGRCTHAPGFDDLPCDGPSRDDLPGASLEHFRGLPFVSLEPAAPLAALLGDVAPRLAHLPLERLAHDPTFARSYVVRAHWALYVENYLEGLHVPFVHPKLSGALDLGAYRTEVFSRSVLQVGVARDGDPNVLPPSEHAPDERAAGYYLWLFPNTMLNVYPWGVSTNVVLPEAPDRTRIVYERFVWDDALRSHGAGGALDEVELEDDAVVESVQQGVGARLYRGGRYAPAWEQGVYALHRMLGVHPG